MTEGRLKVLLQNSLKTLKEHIVDDEEFMEFIAIEVGITEEEYLELDKELA